jgi:15-cis-phytoene synthase
MPRAMTISTDPAERRAFDAAREVCRRHARSFYFASFFLPQPKRYAAYAVYAFCRMIDDAIDVADEPPQRPATISAAEPCGCGSSALDIRLQLFRDRLDEIYTASLPAPGPDTGLELSALYAFQQTVHRYQIPQEYFLDLAEGCRMDLTVKRYATWAALERYCYHVAGVVGLIMCGVFGLTNSGAREQAIEMGNAMQLTNILRDIGEDYDRGRIYLPLEDMARFRYSERDLSRGVVNENFRELMRFEIDRARSLFRSGAQGLCWLAGDGSRLTASAMAVIYCGILSAIERQDYDVFSRRAHLSTPQKFRRLPSAWRLARRQHDQPLPRVF